MGDRRLEPRAALFRLGAFLDQRLELEERLAALNDPRVADGVVSGYLRTLDGDDLELALRCCERPGVLAERVADPLVAVRRAVAANVSADEATLRVLACDEDELVRVLVASHPPADLGVHAWLLADPCPAVRDALLDVEVDEPGDEDATTDMLEFLHHFVPAAVEEDCLEQARHEPAVSVAGELPEPGPPLSDAQAIGLLRYWLGTEPLEPLE